MTHSFIRTFLLVTALALASSAVNSQNTAAQAPARVTPMTPDVIEKYEQTLPSADFIRREAMVPMRDGTKLYTVIVMKKGTARRADPAVAHAL